MSSLFFYRNRHQNWFSNIFFSYKNFFGLECPLFEYIIKKVRRLFLIKRNPVDPEEMKRRMDLDEIAALNMIGEGGPVYSLDEESENEEQG